MKDYTVSLLDGEGFEITSQWARSLAEAKKAAKYLVSEAYAKNAGTTHEALGTDKAEVTVDGECVWDVFTDKFASRIVFEGLRPGETISGA